MSVPPLYRDISFVELATPADIQAESSSRLPKSALLPVSIKRDLCCTPPAFFVGSVDDHLSRSFESAAETTQPDTISGYGNRRLSRVLAESVADANKKKLPSITEAPQKKVTTVSIDPDKGIFGNGRICTKPKENEFNLSPKFDQIKTMEKADPKKTRSVRVFGYPPDSIASILHYFSRFGEIEGYSPSSGNWISITYKKNDYAIAALKTNGNIVFKNCPIGVVLEPEPQDQSQHYIVSPEDGLGSGVAGPSVRHRDDMKLTMVERLKEMFFGW
ncbi:Nucleoporin nup40 [Choanephora cucurbitarum]|uniref:Nucleoporin nup40 n=1 Tax=Choanephora cucurbitarum TaxID=101091 RepID=A0A1C7NIA6_9FUNG|nr:Nucleoporin nup40 [Choanephora cucurbitarum]